VVDYDLQFMEEMLSVVDSKLVKLQAEATESEDPDQFGVFDRAEFVAGMGFAVCQRYITATSGWLKMPKDRALSHGPTLADGTPMARVINAAANYWKHSEEREGPAAATIAVLKRLPGMARALESNSMDHQLQDYVCAYVLRCLNPSQPLAFAPIVRGLESWRDSLEKPSN
jgi:hypothetical protein